MNQSDIFLSSEGDAWYARNKNKLGLKDPVCALLDLLPLIRPKRVLEVGCANGWRLKKLKEKYQCRVSGVDTSHDAVEDALESGLEDVCHDKFGNATWLGGTFDMIIFAFCLYVTQPSDWFKIVTEADRLLADGGWLVIHDFADGPHATPYQHNTGILSYHLNFGSLWTSHPWYWRQDYASLDGECVTVLKKDKHRLPVKS